MCDRRPPNRQGSESVHASGSGRLGGRHSSGAAIGASDSGWAGIACGGGRVAPALRTPLLTLWLSEAVIGDRRHRAIVGLVRAVVAITGAVAGVAFVEAVAPHWRRVARPSPQVAVVANTDSGSARVAGRALRALALEPVEVMSVEKVPAPELSAALARASARLAGGGRLVAAGGDGTIGTVAGWRRGRVWSWRCCPPGPATISLDP